MKRRSSKAYKALVKLSDFSRDYEAIKNKYDGESWQKFYDKYPGIRRFFDDYRVDIIIYHMLQDINDEQFNSAYVKCLLGKK